MVLVFQVRKMPTMRSSRGNDKEHEEEKDNSTAIPLGAVECIKWTGRFTWTQ
jgi:hypothetical protein